MGTEFYYFRLVSEMRIGETGVDEMGADEMGIAERVPRTSVRALSAMILCCSLSDTLSVCLSICLSLSL